MYSRILTRAIFLLMVLLNKEVFANIAAPPSPRLGNITGDSYLRQLTVIREDLAIDMSEIPHSGSVKVRAEYLIECSQFLKNINLIFVANNLSESRYNVKLDGDIQNSDLVPFDTTPSTWLPPDSINWLHGKIPYLYSYKGLISFRLNSLEPGKHTLIVEYEADASEWFEEKDLVITRGFVYILKPTDSWKKFENLHVTVLLPEDWEFSSNLNLKRISSSSWGGYWSKLPAQYLSIATRKSPDQAKLYSVLFQACSWIVFALLGLFCMIKIARYRIRKSKKRIIQVLNVILMSFLASVFFFYIHYTNEDFLAKWLDNHLNPWVGYGYYFLYFPLVWVIALILFFVMDFVIALTIKQKLNREFNV